MRSTVSCCVACLFALAALIMFPASAACDQARLLRYPHIMGDKVVFVYGGDIWTVSVKGGQARRVTSFPDGLELFPKISPDGRWIAFSGEYAGTRQVYVMPFEGGAPRRLTFYPDVGRMPPRGGYDYIVWDWTPDGSKILVRCNRTPYGRRVGRYYLVDPSGSGMEQPLQIPEGGPVSYSPDGKKLAYNIKSREFRNWKRYRAGRAQDVWIYDLEKDSITRITTFEGTDNFPMWIGDAIYFTSDRDRKLNLYRYDIGTGETVKVTNYTEYDVLWPSRGKDRIVFENGGYLFYHDTVTGETKQIPVALGSDKPFVLPYFKNVKDNIESFTISPSGSRAAFSARGEIFTVPAEHGVTRNITGTDGMREMNVEWSPDGGRIAYLSEESGEYEVTVRPQDGSGEPKRLTSGSDSWIVYYVWSPDGKKIAYTDKKNRLWILDVDSADKVEADLCSYSAIRQCSFSPDSRWVCYTKNNQNQMTSIWVYSLDSKQPVQLTGDFSDESDPTFSTDGKYLYFVSGRDFDYMYRRFKERLYVATLSSETPNPLAPLCDEEKPENSEPAGEQHAGDKKGKKGKEGDTDKESKKEAVKIDRIDAEGFDDRVMALPESPGQYRGLAAVEGGLLFITEKGELKKFDLEKRESKTVMEKVDNYQPAWGGKKFIYRSGQDYGIAELSPGQSEGAGKLDLGKMEMRIDPRTEWKQIYNDGWRIMRDWFYDPGMHGVDWTAMRARYAGLIEHVAHRTDLDYVLGELIGELNAGHTYVFSGDMPEVKRVPVGLLGCEFEAQGDYYRISRIYRGENWHEDARSPLTEPGLNVDEGTYLISIDGREVRVPESPYRYLENKAGVQVTLGINDKPTAKGSREIVVTPVESELNLFYMNWVENNRRIVEELSGGRVGYIHVPNTHFEGFREFYKAFQPLMDREALIIDERYNGGGHSPYDMVQMMNRKVYSYWAARHLELVPTPLPVHEGPKVMLINGLSSSGGDAFPYYFRKAGLGRLMGERTWGGLIGYGYSPQFVDGGGFAVPGFAFVNTEGEWDVEGIGVEPDEEIFDDPTLIKAGRQPMLERAVQYLIDELKKHPPKKVEKPAGPDRS